MATYSNLVERAIKLIVELRSSGSRVHCITNTVSQNFTANVLLACGATPSMTTAAGEITNFVSRCDGLLVNLGVMNNNSKIAINSSIDVANSKNIPFVLDPVFCHLSPPRLLFANEIITKKPSILRLNSSEAEALLIKTPDVVSVFTGPCDRIIFGDDQILVENGHPYLSLVTAIGCAQGALMAALASKTQIYSDAALAALLWFGVAAEKAIEYAQGPGSFQPAFIDALYHITIEEITDQARVSEHR